MSYQPQGKELELAVECKNIIGKIRASENNHHLPIVEKETRTDYDYRLYDDLIVSDDENENLEDSIYE